MTKKQKEIRIRFSSRWTIPLSKLWFLLFQNTRRTSEQPKTDGRTAIQTEERGTRPKEWMMRRTSRRLRTTVSAHHVVFPSSYPSPSLPLYYDFSSLLRVFLHLLLLFLTPPSRPLSHFLLFCFHSCLLHLLCYSLVSRHSLCLSLALVSQRC